VRRVSWPRHGLPLAAVQAMTPPAVQQLRLQLRAGARGEFWERDEQRGVNAAARVGSAPPIPPSPWPRAATRTPASPASQAAVAPGQKIVFVVGQAHGTRGRGQVHARPQLQQRQVRSEVPGSVLVRHEARHPLLLRTGGQQHPPGLKIVG
jgi:nucleoid-associated protein YgaU